MTRRNLSGSQLPHPDNWHEREALTMGPTMANRSMGGRYTVQDKIGTGGMAIVYRGLDEVLGRTVAIKTMLPQYANDESFAARFKQEAQAAAALQSPYIVSVYDWGRDGDTYYIIMEYLRGTDLKSGIRKHGALECRKVAQIGSQIAKALTVAHNHDIIHRDIKPQNIMVQPDGNIKVMDFGIARAKNSHLTTDNSVLGTAHYVSPEQTQGHDLGPTSDIYSLGIVMYEAATGQVPFDGDDAISVALKQVNEPPMPPSQINARVDPALEGIILKCMQKRPEDRFQTAAELDHVLRDYLSGRLQAVNEQTAIVANAETNRINRGGRAPSNTGSLTARRQNTGQLSGQTTGHYRTRSATEAELNRKHRRNVAIGIVVTLLAIMGIALGFFLIAGRRSTHVVPKYEGLARDEAIQQIEKSGYFKVGTIKEDFSSEYAVGIVIDQNPDAGNSARDGSSIDLVVSKGEEPAQTVTVPELKNMTAAEAEAALAQVGLIAKASDPVFSGEIEKDRVASQDPAPNTSAKAGATIIYRLSKGAEDLDIPYVVDMTQAEAESALQTAGFLCEVESAESDVYDVGYVSSQSQTGKAKRGTTIVITVSSGSSQRSIPYVVGKSSYAATSDLENAGFYVDYSYSSSSDVPSGSVIWQSSTGSATRGSTITLTISTGPDTSSSSSSSSSGSSSSSSSGSSSSSDDSGSGSSGGSSSEGESSSEGGSSSSSESSESGSGGDSSSSSDSN